MLCGTLMTTTQPRALIVKWGYVSREPTYQLDAAAQVEKKWMFTGNCYGWLPIYLQQRRKEAKVQYDYP